MEAIEITINGARLHTLVREGEPTILFLHGLAGHGGEWKPVSELLAGSVGLVLRG